MNYATIKKRDIANGVGVRVSLFVSGCTHHCKNCFNKETWDFNFGKEFDIVAENNIIELLKPNYVHGITVLGGEPFEPENQPALLQFLKRIKEIYPKKTIWCFTGFTIEELLGNSRANCEHTVELLKLIDVLVDGRYIDELRDITLKFRGSKNQRIIDMNKTREALKVVLWEEE